MRRRFQFTIRALLLLMLAVSLPLGLHAWRRKIARLNIAEDNDVVSQPGTIAFSAATYNANEMGGTATITVTRSGGSSGAVSVTVSTRTRAAWLVGCSRPRCNPTTATASCATFLIRPRPSTSFSTLFIGRSLDTAGRRSLRLGRHHGRRLGPLFSRHVLLVYSQRHLLRRAGGSKALGRRDRTDA